MIAPCAAITYIALDRRLGCLDKDLAPDSEAQQIIVAVHKIFDCLFRLDVEPSLWKYFPVSAYRTMKKTMAWFYGYVQMIQGYWGKNRRSYNQVGYLKINGPKKNKKKP